MAAPIDFVATSRAVAGRLHDYRSRVDRTVAPNDAMFSGDLDDYLSVSDSAIAQIGHTMTICGRTSFDRILDLPCGHGRVMRGLRAAFPDAELTALMILAYVERGLADHQDLIAVLKMDVHHRQGDLLLV